MEKVLVLGNNGMLGHVLFKYLTEFYEDRYEVYGVNRNSNNKKIFKCDVLNFQKLSGIINEIEPHYVVNCIGVLVSESMQNVPIAIEINALLPHKLYRLSKKCNFKFIHISTDCVFDGKKGSYNEEDKKTELGIYGITKNLGEINEQDALTIRTSIIGPEIKLNSTGLFEWVLSNKNNEVYGFKNAMWSGLTTIELAKFIQWSFDKNLNGIVNATNNDHITKYDLIKTIDFHFKLNINLKENLSYNSDKSLINNKVEGYNFLSYNEMICNLKQWMISHSELYD